MKTAPFSATRYTCRASVKNVLTPKQNNGNICRTHALNSRFRFSIRYNTGKIHCFWAEELCKVNVYEMDTEIRWLLEGTVSLEIRPHYPRLESGLLVSGDGKYRATMRNILITDGNAIAALQSRQSVTTEVYTVTSTSMHECENVLYEHCIYLRTLVIYNR
jgi:hypothetical protein